MAGIYINRVFDSVASDFVYWSSEPDPDSAGATYPGPGVFGVTTSDYVVINRTASGAPNFSYKQIDPAETVTIPNNQQMIVVGGFINLGVLVNLGELVLL